MTLKIFLVTFSAKANVLLIVVLCEFLCPEGPQRTFERGFAMS